MGGHIGDYADDVETTKQITRLMQENEVYIIDVFDPLEAFAPPEGTYDAQYQGIHTTLSVYDGKNFETIYQNHFASKRRKIEELCLKYGAQYRQIQTDLPIYTQIRPV